MAQPTPYSRQADFTSFSTNNPDLPQTGTNMDAEFNAILTTLSEILFNLAVLQEDDLTLKNRIVDPTSLANATLALISGDFTPKGDYASGVAYVVGDLVNDGSNVYVCHTAHTSSGALDTTKFVSWTVSVAAADVVFAPAGTITATNLQTAVQELDTDIQTLAIGSVKISANDTTSANLEEKLLVGDNLALSTQNDGSNETRTISLGSDVALTDVVQTFTAAQRASQTALTSTTNSIAVDLALNNDFTHTMTENTTLANPTNAVAGQSGAIHFTQDAATARTLAYGSNWKPAGGAAPSAPTTLSSAFTVYYQVRSATFIEFNLVDFGA